MLSSNGNFDNLVCAKDGHIEHPTCWSTPNIWTDSMVYYGGYHLDVESCAKTVYPNDGNTSRTSETTSTFVHSCDLTTPSFFN